MELKEFIDLTLREILEGIKAAQGADGGENVNAVAHGAKELGGNLINLSQFGVYTRVDFDVSVSGEASGGGGAKLTVWGVGVEGAAEKKSASANRVTFSVPVRLPDGDTERLEKIREENAEREKNRKGKLRESAASLNRGSDGWMS